MFILNLESFTLHPRPWTLLAGSIVQHVSIISIIFNYKKNVTKWPFDLSLIINLKPVVLCTRSPSTWARGTRRRRWTSSSPSSSGTCSCRSSGRESRPTSKGKFYSCYNWPFEHVRLWTYGSIHCIYFWPVHMTWWVWPVQPVRGCVNLLRTGQDLWPVHMSRRVQPVQPMTLWQAYSWEAAIPRTFSALSQVR